MKAWEFARLLDRLELSQTACAEMLYVDARTVRRWVADDAPIPRSVVLLLKLMDRFGMVAADMEKL